MGEQKQVEGSLKLTDTQRKPLFALVRFQKQKGEEVVFDAVFQTPFPLQPGKIVPRGSDEAIITDFFSEVAAVWHRLGYVVSGGNYVRNSENNEVQRSIILCQKALDYESRMRKIWPVRKLLDMWDVWTTDVRAAVIAVVVTVLTDFIMNWLRSGNLQGLGWWQSPLP